MSLKEKLSIILVTSPIVSHPSIELIGKVVSSFNLVDHLSTCSLVIGKRYVKLSSITLSWVGIKPTDQSQAEKMVKLFTNFRLVADGVKLGKFRPKRGSVTSQMIDNYHQFLLNLQCKVDDSVDDGSIWSRTQVIRIVKNKINASIYLREKSLIFFIL